jgi:hypothetical protein
LKISFLQCAPVVQLSCSSDDKNITKHLDGQQHYISLCFSVMPIT